ncbi:trypsin-like [Emydura macquarii macquarii]|uniref:trypsin-like n=1 Tax=Emydura macquarii macquarii TaxID=1129001 RepID=UPI00352ADFA2
MELLIIAMLVAGAAGRSESTSEGEEPRIIGGGPCPIGSRPYQVALLRNGRNYCGGSLIDRKWVLTAAHCTKQIGSLQVRLGDYNLKVNEGTEQIRRIRNYFIHPQYNLKPHDNDFMLLELDEPAQLNSYVNTISLPTSCPAPGRQCSVSGWGTITSPQKKRPDILQCANIYTVSQATCQTTYGGTITDNMLCAGVPQGGISSCRGDSGGPLVCNGKLQGVVSWGKSICALKGQPRVFANVCKVIQWVRCTIAKRCAGLN